MSAFICTTITRRASVICILICLMLLGMTGQVFAVTCGCVTIPPVNGCTACNYGSCYQFTSVEAAEAAAAKALASGDWSYHCQFAGYDAEGDFWRFCTDYIQDGIYNSGLYVACPGCADANGDNLCDPPPIDTDGDGIPDNQDTDDDGDGIPDYQDPDDDGDGIPDGQEDTDSDGIPNGQDTDDDGDGIPDGQDDCPLYPGEQNCNIPPPGQTDTDGDGLPNSEDTDDDGDGIPDSEDTDDDGDGTPDTSEDPDGDGIPNGQDTDDDGDGTPDSEDQCPLNAVAGCTDPDSSCPPECTSQCEALSQSCGFYGYTMTYGSDEQCHGACNVASDCAEQYEAKCVQCGSCNNIKSWMNDICEGLCKDETCESKMNEADEVCPFGYNMDSSTCDYKCKTCNELNQGCITKCGGAEKIASGLCHETNGVPDDFLCNCTKPNNCETFYEYCYQACSPSECGGVKTKDCQVSNGEIVYKKCECNTCGNGQEPPPPGPNDDTPDPEDQSDLAGWLKSIKGDTGVLIEQGKSNYGWFSQIKSNGDKTNDLLGALLHKDTKVDMSSVTSAVNGVNSSVGALNSTMQGVNTQVSAIRNSMASTSADVGAIKNGLSNLAINADAGTYADIPQDGYGEEPTDADLPTEEESKSAFGEFKPDEESDTWRGQVSSSLGALAPPFSDVDCSVVFTVPSSMPFIGGKTYDMNFCPFADGLSKIGAVLVFLAALRELYLFA